MLTFGGNIFGGKLQLLVVILSGKSGNRLIANPLQLVADTHLGN